MPSALSTYRRIFDAPGSLAFCTAGFVARLPKSMQSVGVIVMLSATHRYALAGAVAATIALSTSAIGPQVSRLVDRFGQGRVMLTASGVSVAAMSALVLCVYLGAPAWTLFPSAAVAGCMPSMSSLVRARWAHIYAGSPMLHPAYSFESVLTQISYVVGPPLAAVVSTAVFPEAGPALTTLLLAVGTVLLAAQRRTEPPLRAPRQRKEVTGSVLRSRGLGILVLTYVGLGVVLGSMEVATVAFADHVHHKALSGVVLGVYALGSCIAGLVFGTLSLRGPLSRRYLTGVVVMALSMLPLLFVTNLVFLAAALFLAGMLLSPTMITTNVLVQRIVPASRLTEGMTWTVTGLAVGAACGSAIASAVVERSGAAAGYEVTVIAALLAVATALIGARRLSHALAQARTAPASAVVDVCASQRGKGPRALPVGTAGVPPPATGATSTATVSASGTSPRAPPSPSRTSTPDGSETTSARAQAAACPSASSGAGSGVMSRGSAGIASPARAARICSADMRPLTSL
ncbi:MFS transporter [Streptomyces sp. NPDC101151]|uniref:MFS transporter n=1 Tax=Streptomyces sp. NPDC101151 TaxID=3366115 RepID=UPI003816B2D3